MHNENAIESHSDAGLLAYQMPKSPARVLGNGIIASYMSLGMTVPLTIAFIFLSVVLQPVASSAALSVAAIAFAVIATISVMFTWLWMLMTPIALVALICQKRFVGLMPTFIYIAFAFLCGLIYQGTKEYNPALVQTGFAIAFSSIAFIATKYQIKVFKQIQSEPKYATPKVLGCGGDTHELPGAPQ